MRVKIPGLILVALPARAILDGVEAGQEDIFPDAFAVSFGEQFHSSPKASEQQIAAMLTGAAAA